MTADLIIANARVRTLDPDLPFASHIALSDGVIAAVGGARAVGNLISPCAELLDGKELAIVPGLTDSHFHPFRGAISTEGVDGEQALTGAEALAGYTTEAARIVSEQHISGQIKVGYRAELTAFAADPVDCAPDDLIDLPILMTMVNGRIVFRSET